MVFVLRLSSGGAIIQRFEKTLQPHLYQYFKYINNEIGNPPNLQTAKSLSKSLKIKIVIKGPNLRWSSDGAFPDKSHFRFRHHSNRQNDDSHYKSGRYKHHFVFRIPNPPYQTTIFTRNDSDLPSPGKLLFNSLLGILLVLGLLYFLLRHMISPIKNIQKSIKRIGSGDLNHRIHLNRNDEFGELSKEINAMTDDIENMLEAKRQLLLAISHELRSPITRAKVATSLMENGQLKEGIESDLKDMEEMVSGLLEAERLNHRHQALNLSDTAINSLISDVIKQQFPHASIKKILDKNIAVLQIDEARFQFMIKNLLDNALKYQKKDNSEVIIKTKLKQRESSGKSLILTVEDQGIGIPKEHLSHLTEPFYRVDPSRHRETGGYGLGLYIIRMIVEAHNGTININSEVGVGTKIIVSIPM